MTVLVRYHSWRAAWAIALPLIAMSIPAADYVIDAADFHRRYHGGPSDWILALGIVWFVYALWPSAFRHFSGGIREISIDGNVLRFSNGERFDLSELRGVEIERPALQPPLVVLTFPASEISVQTAYQPIGEKKTAERIASQIAELARTSVK